MVKAAFAFGGVLALLAAIAYLRDPPWLIDVSSGLRPWQQTAAGVRYRWSGGHASFFVPSDARRIGIPIATTFDARGARPMLVTITIDDQRAARLVLNDGAWRRVLIAMPPRGSRRVRRVDIRTNVVREDNRGVQVGEIAIER